ncbi:MAG: hypothetical protein NDJ90_07985 [Oligoflexia bacterium]|nr:hypothetical protein [Oligoflexia bacterium]
MSRKRQEHQLTLPGLTKRTRPLAHGGDVTRGKRKTARPFDHKQALHVVLRSSKARGERSLLHPRHCNHVRALTKRLEERWGVTVYRYANVGNHLHLLVRARTRPAWQGFIRELSGGIAMLVTGARKGQGLPREKAGLPRGIGVADSAQRGFWDELVFTRIVAYGRDFAGVARYVCTNLWEGAGVPMRKYLARGYQALEISDDGGLLIQKRAGPGHRFAHEVKHGPTWFLAKGLEWRYSPSNDRQARH